MFVPQAFKGAPLPGEGIMSAFPTLRTRANLRKVMEPMLRRLDFKYRFFRHPLLQKLIVFYYVPILIIFRLLSEKDSGNEIRGVKKKNDSPDVLTRRWY